ncbi:MAG: cation:proton antiporter [Polyangiales bacterium]
MHGAPFVTDLAVVLGVAAITGVLARLMQQPTILGYLLAGLIVGPHIPVPVFANPERVGALAEFGVILVMFAVGLEFRIGKLVRVLPMSGLTGIIQVGVLIWCGFTLGQWLRWSTVESVFLGACIAISSTMVVSKVYEQIPVGPDVRRYVFGVLIIQDVVAIVLIAAMTAIVAGGGLAPAELAATVGRLAVVLVGMVVGGLLIVPRLIRAVAGLNSVEILSVVSIGLCFVIALLAEQLGYSVALGAFIAGILVAESGRGSQVEHLIQPVRDMFAAVFFVSIGMTVDPRLAIAHLPTTGLVFAVVVLAQFLSVSVAGVLSGNGLRRSITAGLSLGQIGEFSFILASIGIAANAVRSDLQPILVTVAILTTFTTPLLLGAVDRVVERIDRLLPPRMQALLGLYEEWSERIRSKRDGRERPLTRRAIRALALDAAALIAILVLTVVGLARASSELAPRLEVSLEGARWIVAGGALLFGLPFLVGLLRNTISVSRLLADTVAPPEMDPSSGARLVNRTIRVTVYLIVALGVGVPAIAVLRPLTGKLYGVSLLSVVVIAIGVYLWRSAGFVGHEFRSAAEQIADVLARQGGDDRGEVLSDPSLIPGMDSVFGLRISENSSAVGRTLAEVNLRALTGATVVAIRRGAGNVVLPTGHERIEPDDVLAITGTAEAIREAVSQLTKGPAHKDAEFATLA